ncbi:MAG: nitrite reductase large subunit [Alphaproteobacteria bacterium]|jgi:nitrite reductase (NADH) large subunit|nr:nitrite reductase large subunit [Alphaproteobacteria bacterium]
MSEPLIVIGNGMAAARFVDELARRALGRYAVAVIGEEPRLAYNRVLLSALLADEVGFDDIELRPARWWRDRGVTLRYGVRATAVDAAARNVTLAGGIQLSFSKLVFATGSQPIKPDIPGMDLPGVLTFRDVDDVNAIAASKAAGTRVVVIGGGLLGLEAAYGLAKAGARVTLLHLIDRLMERHLDHRAALMLQRAVEARGIAVRLQAQTARIAGNGKVEGVELRDGTTIAADAVVVAVGIRANAALARTAGIEVGRGIVVDDHLETNAAGVHAIGECAEHRGCCYGLVEPAYEQAQLLARRLAGERASYPGSVLATNLKVSGVNVFSAGDFLGATAEAEEIVLSDPAAGVYKKLVIAHGRLVGAVLFGDTADGLWYLDLIRTGSPVARLRDDLVFGRALATRTAA